MQTNMLARTCKTNTNPIPSRSHTPTNKLTTRWDGCDRVGLSPLARARGVRRCPRAQTLLLEHGDTRLRIARASYITAALAICCVWWTTNDLVLSS